MKNFLCRPLGMFEWKMELRPPVKFLVRPDTIRCGKEHPIDTKMEISGMYLWRRCIMKDSLKTHAKLTNSIRVLLCRVMIIRYRINIIYIEPFLSIMTKLKSIFGQQKLNHRRLSITRILQQLINEMTLLSVKVLSALIQSVFKSPISSQTIQKLLAADLKFFNSRIQHLYASTRIIPLAILRNTMSARFSDSSIARNFFSYRSVSLSS